MSWVTELSDFFTTHWGEILAILTSSTVLPTIVSCIFKAFVTKSQSKSIKKLISAVDDKFNSIETKLAAMEEQFKSLSEGQLEQYKEVLKEFAEEYAKAKKQLCDKIVAGKDAVKTVLEEAEKVAEELEEKLEWVGAPVEEPEPQEEELLVKELVEETPKTKTKVAKRVIVEE